MVSVLMYMMSHADTARELHKREREGVATRDGRVRHRRHAQEYVTVTARAASDATVSH